MKKITLALSLLILAFFGANAQNNALNFVAANSNYVAVPVSTGIPTGNSNYTIEAWIYANSMGTFGIAGWGNYGTQSQVNAFRLEGGSGYLINYWWNNDLQIYVGDISGAWHHVAVTFDGTNRIMYLDGAIIGGDQPSGHNVPTDTNLTIGKTVGGEFFDGSLDEVKIWDIALTQSQIVASMSRTNPPSASDLIAYYAFDQGTANGNNTIYTTVMDTTGNGNTGTLKGFTLTGSTSNFVGGAPAVVPTAPAGALNFDGVASYVNAGKVLSASYTKEAWVFLTADNGANNIISGGQSDLTLGQNAFWAPGLQLAAGHNGSFTDVIDGDPMSLYTWYYVAVTYDSATTTMNLYKNGTLVSQSTTEPQFVGGDTDLIGAYDGSSLFTGSIDEVRIWNHALTQEQVQSDMNHQLCVPQAGLTAYYTFNQGIEFADNTAIIALADTSGNNNNGVFNNFALTGVAGNFVNGISIAPFCSPANVLQFDGSGTFASNNVFDTITNNITMEARVNWIGNTGNNQAIFLNGDGGADGYGLSTDAGNNDSLFIALGNVEFIPTHVRLTENKWQMLSLERNAGIWTLYLDGVPHHFADSNRSPIALGTSGSDAFTIGADNTGGSIFWGFMDEFRYWNRVLCQDEIQSRLDSELKGNEANLIALYNFNEGVADGNNTAITIIADNSGNNNNIYLNNFYLASGSGSDFEFDGNGLSAISVAYVPPVSNITASGAIIFCQSDSVKLTADTGLSYSWSNGGSSSIAATRSIVVKSSGTYKVSVTNPNGCYGVGLSNKVKVIVNTLPVINVTADAIGGNTVCQGNIDTLKGAATGNGVLSYSWNNGGTYDTTLIHTAGVYTLTVTDGNGCKDTVSERVIVKVSPLPSVVISGNVVNGFAVCSGSIDSLTAKASGGAGSFTYKWNTGGTYDTVLVKSNGSYTVKVTDANGCYKITSQSVTVNTLPVVTVTGNVIGGTTICAGLKDTLMANATGNGLLSYLWSTGSSKDTAIVKAANSYSVVVTDGNGCKKAAGTTVTVNAKPVVSITGNVIGGTTICAGLKDTLLATATGNGLFTYAWNTGSTRDTTIVTTAATYSVLVTDANGCKKLVTTIVSVNALPTVGITGTSNITLGSNDVLTGTGTATSYLWSDGSTHDTANVVPTGNATYTLTGKGADGCTDTATFKVTVGPTGISAISNTGNTTLYPDPTVSIINLSFEMQGNDRTAVITIIDISGKEVMTESTTISNGKATSLNVSGLASGMYFVKVITETNIQVVKFVKE